MLAVEDADLGFQFRFEPVFAAWQELLTGAWLTIQLSLAAMAIGLVVAVLCALGKTAGPKPVRWLVNGYIEIVRNTPFLVQIFFIFFGLPALGLRLSPGSAALLALVINVGAYAAEIIRAGIEAVPRGQIEAGIALGLKPLSIFRHIVLKPALRATFPALTSQFMLLMLSTSVLSAISADELTSMANNIQSRTFSSFEVYLVVTVIYFVIYMLFSGLFAVINRRVFSYPSK